ncbi:hypothetical protein HPB48_010634 [Haemaphysalis longicornis]|uniref:GPR158/179 extracellular domain-containing protein n=1 Tax=Haemaphysalis longicornis TaxID=44386 RepID=A0A9J6G0G6_HAELO|nr:hypothetical protein HPB48_010634 [Haemaphysalis longicornis]
MTQQKALQEFYFIWPWVTLSQRSSVPRKPPRLDSSRETYPPSSQTRVGTIFKDCERKGATCEPSPGLGFRRGGYQCRCREGFYAPPTTAAATSSSPSTVTSAGATSTTSSESAVGSGEALEAGPPTAEFRCLPCPARCGGACQQEQPWSGEPEGGEAEREACFVQYNMAWRSLALGLQGFCTTVTVVLMVVVFRSTMQYKLSQKSALIGTVQSIRPLETFFAAVPRSPATKRYLQEMEGRAGRVKVISLLFFRPPLHSRPSQRGRSLL